MSDSGLNIRRLVSLRTARGVSQDAVAKACGVSRGRISQVETGVGGVPSWPLVCSLAAFYGVETDYLRSSDNTEPTPPGSDSPRPAARGVASG